MHKSCFNGYAKLERIHRLYNKTSGACHKGFSYQADIGIRAYYKEHRKCKIIRHGFCGCNADFRFAACQIEYAEIRSFYCQQIIQGYVGFHNL